MNGVVVLAHGSREIQAAEAWTSLEQAVRQRLDGNARIVFQFGMDGLPDALDTLAGNGADAITILPYFLFTGFHLKHTVPRLMRVWQEAHPKVRLSLAPALGEDSRFAALLAERIARDMDVGKP